MNYEQALDFVMSRRKFQKTSSLERIKRLLYLLGEPQKNLNFVHIVGTNGKGSTSTALSYIFSEAGYITGLFTSPFVVEFGERIQVNNEYISKSEIAEIVSLIKEKTEIMEKEDLHPTVFEVTTALAMVYFKKKNCEIVFLEAGIGGEHDSTNVISSPLAAVFASISLDHTEMLGETTREIAEEKCGIIKEETTVISYPFESGSLGFFPQDEVAAGVIEKRAKEKGCPLKTADTRKVKILSDTIDGLEFLYESFKIKTSMTGRFQVGNILTAIETTKALRKRGFSVFDDAIEKGIEKFNIPARTEKVGSQPLIILDGGHNESSISALKSTIESYLKDKKITLLLSFMKDKDYETCLKILAPLSENLVFTNVDKLRGENTKVLLKKGKEYTEKVFENEKVKEAFELALSKTERDGALIVAGSFYLASEIRSLLKKN